MYISVSRYANTDTLKPYMLQLDITRHNASKHLGFGVGAHACLGRNLALVEAQIALTCLLSRTSDIKLAINREDIHWKPLDSLATLISLPVISKWKFWECFWQIAMCSENNVNIVILNRMQYRKFNTKFKQTCTYQMSNAPYQKDNLSCFSCIHLALLSRLAAGFLFLWSLRHVSWFPVYGAGI